MSNKVTREEFIKRMHAKIGNDYQLVSDYVDTKTKVTLKHLKCGNTYQVCPSAVIHNGNGCPFCGHISTANKLKDNFTKWVEDNYGDEYTVLGNYVNARTKIKMRHNKCGTEFMALPTNFKSGHTCPKCGIQRRAKKRTMSNEDFVKRIHALVGDEYTPLTKYHKAREKVTFRHNVCGNTFEMTPNSFLQGRRCPICNPQTPLKTNEQFIKELKVINNTLVPLTAYQGVKKPITIKCTVCGNTFETIPDRLLNGKSSCPYCAGSLGERSVAKYLKAKHINYEYQKKFDDLKDKNYLSYDFYLPDCKTLIEYNGIQHYQSISHFNNDHSNFKLQIKHDKMKTDYALAHHYRLISIPYTIESYHDISNYLNSILFK